MRYLTAFPTVSPTVSTTLWYRLEYPQTALNLLFLFDLWEIAKMRTRYARRLT